MKIVHIQSVLPQEDVIALKEKAHESSIKEAISKAVYHYLKCDRSISGSYYVNLSIRSNEWRTKRIWVRILRKLES
jgi:hypothetical protein